MSLDAAALARAADALAGLGDAGESAAPSPPLHLAVARVHERLVAVPVGAVLEIVRVGLVTRVPGAPAGIRGLTNLRGRALPVLDAGVRLGEPPVALDLAARLIVLESPAGPLGLLCSAARELVRVPAAAVATAAPGLAGEGGAAAAVAGAFELGGRSVLLLDPARLIAHADAEAPTP
jgi:purine-binding chemotaxis protein CheW